jgi:hypothetical protein
MIRSRLAVVLLALIFAACQPNVTTTLGTPPASLPTLQPTPSDPGFLVPPATPNTANLPLLAAQIERVQAALEQPIPILALEGELDDSQQTAQNLVLNDPFFVDFAVDVNGRAQRAEVFGIYPLRESDITDETNACLQTTCYRVEIYNYASNFYLAVVVDVDGEQILSVGGYENTQPDIPDHLTDIALEIAVNSPQVAQALGYTPETSAALMENTKTSLNGTLCERSRHLCVAPTFVIDGYALWAIVDLTEGMLVGARWTEVGSVQAAAITEKDLENEAMMRLYCERNTSLERDGWRLDYMLTSSDGLRISDVSFEDVALIHSAKLVDWHVNYSLSEGFGYSDAVGCPVFSQAAVIAVVPPVVEDILDESGQIIGFALVQDFWSEFWPIPCNYYYQQRYEFYQDGRFRPIVASFGRGCGNDGTYRPVTRIALADQFTFSEWDGSAWQSWTDEGWRLAGDIPTDGDGYQFRLSDQTGGGFYVVPSTGQFDDGGRGDDPYVYVTRRHADRDEGDADMPTIGPCCNVDYRQGPENFIEPDPESLADAPIVLWYVPQLKNDDTPGSEYCWADTALENGIYVPRPYPCPSGPMFVPFTGAGES